MNSKKRVIALSGMPGAGKGIASQAAKLLGFEVLVLGDVIREETERRGLEPTPQNVGAVMLEVRAKEGPAVVSEEAATQNRELSLGQCCGGRREEPS